MTDVHFPPALLRVDLPDFDFASDFSLVTTLEKKRRKIFKWSICIISAVVVFFCFSSSGLFSTV